MSYSDPYGLCDDPQDPKCTKSGHDGPGGSVIIEDPDAGTQDVRSGGSRSWRNNNPGNLENTSFSQGHGSIGQGGRFAVFPDELVGKKALTDLLGTHRYQSLTVNDAVARFAPPTENNTAAYQASVERQTGLAGSTPMSTLNSGQVQSVAGAIKTHEGWRPGTVTSTPLWP